MMKNMKKPAIICTILVLLGAIGSLGRAYESEIYLESDVFTELDGTVAGEEFNAEWDGSWSGPEPFGDGTCYIENYGFTITGDVTGDLPAGIVGYGYTFGEMYVESDEGLNASLRFATVRDPSGSLPWHYGSVFDSEYPSDFAGTMKFQILDPDDEATMSGVLNVAMFDGEQILSQQITFSAGLSGYDSESWSEAPATVLQDLALTGTVASEDLGIEETAITAGQTQLFMGSEEWSYICGDEGAAWGTFTMPDPLGEGNWWMALPAYDCLSDFGELLSDFEEYDVTGIGMLTTSNPDAPEAIMVGGYVAEDAPVEGEQYWTYEGYAEHVLVPEPSSLGICLCVLATCAIGLVWRRGPRRACR